MTILRRTIPATIALALLSTTAHCMQETAQEDEVLMRLSPKENTTYRYSVSSTLEQDVESYGGATNNGISTDLDISLTVTDVTLGRSTLQFRSENGGLRTRTRLDERMPLMDSVLRLNDGRGLAVTVTCDPTGRIMGIESSTSDAELSMLNSMRVLDRIIMQYPAERVSPGDRWVSELVDTMPAPQGNGRIITTIELEETFVSVVDTLGVRCWLIEGESSSMNIRGGISVPGMEIDVVGAGSMRTRAVIDARTGLPVRSELLLDNRMTLRAADRPEDLAVPSHARMRVIIAQRPRRP